MLTADWDVLNDIVPIPHLFPVTPCSSCECVWIFLQTKKAPNRFSYFRLTGSFWDPSSLLQAIWISSEASFWLNFARLALWMAPGLSAILIPYASSWFGGEKNFSIRELSQVIENKSQIMWIQVSLSWDTLCHVHQHRVRRMLVGVFCQLVAADHDYVEHSDDSLSGDLT